MIVDQRTNIVDPFLRYPEIGQSAALALGGDGKS